MSSFPGGHAVNMVSTLLNRPIPVLVVSALLALLLTPLVIRGAYKLGWLAYPRSDRWHTRVVALMGGVGIVGSMLLVSLAGGVLHTGPVGFPLLVGMVVLAVLGGVDDRGGVNPLPKLVIELAAAAGIIAAGVRFAPSLPEYLSIPLTVVWIIGVTNAMNLLDNMDGLAAGAGVVIGGTVGALAVVTGDNVTSLLAFSLTGACLGYLPFNYRRARVFMGDTGSLPLGFVVATLALIAGQRAADATSSATWGIMLPLLLCALPLVDTTLVTISRVRTGRAISQGGRDHASHRLVYTGLSDTAAVLTLHASALVVALCAMIGTLAPESGSVLAVAGTIASVATLTWLLRIDPYAPPASVAGVSDVAIAHIQPSVARNSDAVSVQEPVENLPRRAVLVRRAN